MGDVPHGEGIGFDGGVFEKIVKMGRHAPHPPPPHTHTHTMGNPAVYMVRLDTPTNVVIANILITFRLILKIRTKF